MSLGDIPADHLDFALQRSRDFFSQKLPRSKNKKRPSRYNLAILYDPDDPTCPSDQKAIDKFKSAADDLSIATEIINKDEFRRLAEFDALFIRETTSVVHHTFRFARKAQAEGLFVIDDADSILKCTNKVFLNELLLKHEMLTPRTTLVHQSNVDEVPQVLGYPIILKKPDSSTSLGVSKADTLVEYQQLSQQMLSESELVIAQEFLPTTFDWRIGILAGEPLYACKYYMAARHWQIVLRTKKSTRYGKVETIPLGQVPHRVLSIAKRAAELIGDGLYGIDIKQIGNKFYVIEINDNPTIESGIEDMVAGDGLYRQIMVHFLTLLDRRTRSE